jgi:hypothetical protein
MAWTPRPSASGALPARCTRPSQAPPAPTCPGCSHGGSLRYGRLFQGLERTALQRVGADPLAALALPGPEGQGLAGKLAAAPVPCWAHETPW